MGRRILHLRSGRTASPGEFLDLCRGATPLWELTADGALLDISGTDRLHGPGLDGIETLCRRAGCPAAGSGPTVLAARLASRLARHWGGGMFAVGEGSVAAFLARFPVACLPARPGEVARLRRLGVQTCGDLQVVPPDLLKAVFGERGRELADEAAGRSGRSLVRRDGVLREDVSGLELVAGVRLDRPLSAAGAGLALRRGLALRALALCPEGPGRRPLWRLTVMRPDRSLDQAAARGPDRSGWSAWTGLVDLLWERLPRRRTGLLGAELHASPPRPAGPLQPALFPADEIDRRLAAVLARIRRGPGGAVAVAGEERLRAWGARWFGPGEDISRAGRGLVDAPGGAS